MAEKKPDGYQDKRARSAITGQFVTQEQAGANPDTTVLELIEKHLDYVDRKARRK